MAQEKLPAPRLIKAAEFKARKAKDASQEARRIEGILKAATRPARFSRDPRSVFDSLFEKPA